MVLGPNGEMMVQTNVEIGEEVQIEEEVDMEPAVPLEPPKPPPPPVLEDLKHGGYDNRTFDFMDY